LSRLGLAGRRDADADGNTIAAAALAGRLLRAAAMVLAVHGCAAAPAAPATASKYPQRGPGCEIALYRTAVPGAAVWDDLGVAEIACHVSSSVSQCMQLLKAEGCRMGGDMIYNIPREPLRPQDQVMVFRGQVAHTLPGKPHKESDDADLPPPATKEEASGPVLPLTGRAAPATPAPAPPTDAPATPESPKSP